MNMDFYGYFNYGDDDAVRQFVLAHYFAHEAEANAIATQFGRSITTYNAAGFGAVDPWIALMHGEDNDPARGMYDWLQAHNDNHQTMLSIIGGGGTSATLQTVDLSLANFANEEEMYDWLTAHQQLHQFEQTSLGLT